MALWLPSTFLDKYWLFDIAAFWHLQAIDHFNGLVQDCSNSIVLAMELLQSCTNP